MTVRCSPPIRRRPRMAASPGRWTSPGSAPMRCARSVSMPIIASTLPRCVRRSRSIARSASSRFSSSHPPARSTSARSTISRRSRRCAARRGSGFTSTAPSVRSRSCRPSSRRMLGGIELADSIALDFHKWGQVPYDAGFLLVRDGEQHRQAFAQPAAYLRREARGLAAGAVWPCDLGPDLSRGFRALKTWFTLKTFGTDRLGAVIARSCALAKYLETRVLAEPRLELLAPVNLNIVCFRYRARCRRGQSRDRRRHPGVRHRGALEHDAGRQVRDPRCDRQSPHRRVATSTRWSRRCWSSARGERAMA